MPIENMSVANMVQFGKLVEAWTTGNSSIVGDGRSYPIPKDLPELIDQCQLAGVGLQLPTRIKAVQFIQMNLETFLVRLPPKELVLQAREQVQAAQATTKRYPFRTVYDDFYDCGLKSGIDLLDYLAAIIGDYTISNCGS